MPFDISKIDQKIGASRYFTWREALWLPSMEAIALPDATQARNIERLALELDKVRDHFKAPIAVHCWLRPKNYNKFIGGAPASLHIAGLAVDFHVGGVSCSEAKRELLASGIWKGRMELDTVDWVHLDLGAGSNFYGRRQAI
jgi:hypothetical protein